MSNRKGVASLAAFSLILLLLFGVFLLAFTYYNNSKEDISEKNIELELLNTALSFRSDLIQLSYGENTSMNYTNGLDSQATLIFLNNSLITAQRTTRSSLIEVNVSSLGLDFCSEYNFTPRINTTFTFDGTCISMSTN